MRPTQIAAVQTSFMDVLALGDAVPQLFYGRLFALDPTLRPLFGDDMQAQGRKLMTMLTIVVRGLTRLDTLVPAVEALGQRHVAYGVTDKHYATVGAALLWTLHQGLGREWTPVVEEAWTTAYSLLTDVMLAAAAMPELVTA